MSWREMISWIAGLGNAFIGYGILIIAPIFSAYFAMNSYKFNNYKEMYFWIFIGMLCFTVALFALGVL